MKSKFMTPISTFTALCFICTCFIYFVSYLGNTTLAAEIKSTSLDLNHSSKHQNKIPDKLPLGNSKQAIIVTTPTESSVNMVLNAYEKTGHTWHLKFTTNGVVGLKGISLNKKEGDLKTPEGIFGFLFEFGSAPSPGTKMEYRQTHPGDYWSSVPTQEEYNTWVTYNGDPEIRFGHGNYENLYTTSVYKYAAALDYDYGVNKVIGNGSAIFFHIESASGNGTAGCIAIPEAPLVQILKWMNPNKAPKIAIGTPAYFDTF
ncbi:L,D-transpeptidase family protein [Clostridium felsineum]|uniref:L,D-TPase catalytic domain-containing protein n=1 Tax=Clostridium felsineum TaxID=36839 RepID=A0A1S8L191_9CLOT|nr:L,D-transpeptidase family protein [Clostridium felsineum]URZ02871.1 hypothetical protein CLAUR_029050 [Clostridium felsineum]URZ08792.1 hypothetical protein CLROS_041860 [Clostridium felsineum]URZ09420.1 hypothetical protein CROST_000910 [Clostridium felsineum]URZ14225.1 hypothetical protein CLFE_002100 [Clostridium felsineum DSM 794]